MKTITFGFSKARSSTAWFSKAICWAQGTPFSHVYIKFAWPASGANLIYQASHTSVNFEPLALEMFMSMPKKGLSEVLATYFKNNSRWFINRS